MIIFLLIFGVTVLCSMRLKPKEFNSEYCSPQNTARINGIFSVLIFLSHSVDYVELSGALDEPYLAFKAFLSQSVVITYMFYSGYGIMESIKRKGYGYVKSMPFNRIFRLWYHFAITVLMFTAVNFITGKEYSLSHQLLAFTGYTSIGNSNWYIFDMLVLYVIFVIAFSVFKKKHFLGAVLFCGLTGVFAVWEVIQGLPPRFYGTIYCVPMGVFYSLVKPYAEKIIMKNNIIWLILTALSVGIFAFFGVTKDVSFMHYFIFTVFGVVMIVLISMKFRLKSKILDWFGRHIFSFFILQRIPMILLSHFKIIENPYIFVIVCFVLTIALSAGFDFVISKADKKIFKT